MKFKKITVGLVIIVGVTLNGVSMTAQALKENGLTEQEKRAGWRLLFNGVDFSGWQELTSENAPQKGWQVKEGWLTVLAKQQGGDIITREAFGDFELSLEVRLSSGANSGIKYFIQPPCSVGFEYQVLDDDKNPDAKAGINGNRKFASLYDLLPAQNTKPKAIGGWNQVRVIVKGDSMEHWLNGDKVLAFDRSSERFREAYQKSKFKPFKEFGTYRRGHILLQEHGHTVSYRNIKIRPL